MNMDLRREFEKCRPFPQVWDKKCEIAYIEWLESIINILRVDIERRTRERNTLIKAIHHFQSEWEDHKSYGMNEIVWGSMLAMFHATTIIFGKNVTKEKCRWCNGIGWTYAHHNKCDGSCSLGLCPVQEQCEKCHGIGYINIISKEENNHADAE